MENFNSEENNFSGSSQEPEDNFPVTEPEKNNGIVPKISPITAAFVGLLGVFILYQIGGSLLTVAVLGFDLKNADVTAVRLLTVAGQMLFILLPALILSRLVYTDVTTVLRFRLPKYPGLLLFVAGLLCLTPLLQSYLYIQNVIVIKLANAFPLVNKLKFYIDQIDKMVEESYSTILASHSVFESLLIIIVVAIVPAVCEEVFFRGYIQKSFEFRFRPLRSALITAIFFGLYHFHPYQIVPLAALGLYFGYAVYLSDSIFTSVFLHFINNLFAVIVYFIYGSDDITMPKNVTTAEIWSSIFIFIGLLVLFSFIIVYINRVYSKRLN